MNKAKSSSVKISQGLNRINDQNFMISQENFLNSQIFGNNNSSFLQTQISADNNPSNLKGKLKGMEDMSKLISEEVMIHESERGNLKVQKTQLETILLNKLEENNVTLNNQIEKVKNEAYRFMAQETAETNRLKAQETCLKNENEVLKQKILSLQNRIQELETNIGNSDHNFGNTFEKIKI